MELPVIYKKAPFYMLISMESISNGENKILDISDQDNITAILYDGENKLTWKSTDTERPVLDFNDNFKQIYVSEIDLDSLNIGTIQGVAALDNVVDLKDVRDQSLLTPVFELKETIL